MSKLIFAPAVFQFSEIDIKWSGVSEWMHYNGYNDGNSKILYDLEDNIQNGSLKPADALSELCARFCYRAFKSGRPSPEHIYNIIESGHGSVLAHVSVTLAIQGVSRSLTHELVRHHVGVNPSQESQRYVDARDINFVVPPIMYYAWSLQSGPVRAALEREFMADQQQQVEKYIETQKYLSTFLENHNPFHDGEKLKKRINEASRCHLPNASETRLTWTMNLRAARDILGSPTKRGSEGADLEIRRLALEMLEHFRSEAPLTFQDFEVVEMPVVNGIKSKFGGV